MTGKMTEERVSSAFIIILTCTKVSFLLISQAIFFPMLRVLIHASIIIIKNVIY